MSVLYEFRQSSFRRRLVFRLSVSRRKVVSGQWVVDARVLQEAYIHAGFRLLCGCWFWERLCHLLAFSGQLG